MITVIKGLNVKGVNAEGNGVTAGLSGLPTAICGFSEVLQLKKIIGSVKGTAVGVHQFDLFSNKQVNGYFPCITRNTNAYNSDKSSDMKKFISPSIVMEVKGDMIISLVIKHELRGNKLKVSDKIEDFLIGSRLMGGTCFSYESVESFYDGEPANEMDDFDKSIRKLSGVNFLKNRADLMIGNPLDAILDALKVTRMNGESTRNQSGWIVPIAVGFEAIETPKKRMNLRRDVPHVYVEDMTSLGEFISLSRSMKNDFDDLYWHYKQENNHYFVTTL